jgi:hypothetical protein
MFQIAAPFPIRETALVIYGLGLTGFLAVEYGELVRSSY